MRPLALLTIFPFAAQAALNGRCTGSAATGSWGASGICIRTSTCASYDGVHKRGACPNDPDDVRCCLLGLEGSASVNPCGVISWCDWTSGGQCHGTFQAGHSPGGTNYQCCFNPL